MKSSNTPLLSTLEQIAPNPYLQFFIIIVLFLLAAKLLDILLSRYIRRLLKKTKISFDDQLLNIFHRPIFVSIILFGLMLGATRMNFPYMVHFVTTGIIKTVAILIWAKAGYRFLSLVIEIFSHDQSKFTLIQKRTQPLFINFILILVVAIALYFIFLAWNINVTAWMASAGIAGLAISFAAKDTLANLFAGVFIMADAPYKLKDMIVLESGERGQVTHIGIRSTRILTRDDVEITLPNSIMGNVKIINEAGGPSEKYRIRIKVGVAYGSDIDKVHNVLFRVAQHHSAVCKSPSPRVRFRSFGNSSLDHELLCWVEKPVLRGRVTHELNTDIYKRFIEENIEIPFPQRELHLKSVQSPISIGER
jgi:small-conductance mechanosensitive channel